MGCNKRTVIRSTAIKTQKVYHTTMQKIISLFRYHLLSLIVLFTVAHNTVAESVSSSLGFGFTLDPQATTLYHTAEDASDYIIALGKYKKRNGRWSPETSRRVQGELIRYTLEIPKHNSEADVFAFYRDQLPQQAQSLFACTSRACGDSNNWANDHFGVKQLYGTNTSQHYAVFSLQHADDSVTYITIYTVRRGNRRLYSQLDILRSHSQ